MHTAKFRTVLFSAVVGVVTFDHQAIAGTSWDGGGANNLWSTPANWNLDTLPLNNGSSPLSFNGSTRLTPDMDANWGILSLLFNTGAGAFTLNSTGNNTLTIGAGGIINQSGDPAIINTAITLSAAQTWSADVSAPLTLSRNLNLNTRQLTLTGSNTTTISGAISGSGGGSNSLRKIGTGTLILSGNTANTYTGGTTFDSGTIVLAKTGGVAAIPVGDFVIGDGSGTDTVVTTVSNQFATNSGLSIQSSGVVDFNNLVNTIGGLSMFGGLIREPNLMMPGIVNHAGAITSSIGAGTLNFRGGQTIFQVNDGAPAIDLTIAAVLTNGGFTKNGTGAMELTGASNFAGGATLGAGTLIVFSTGNLGTGTVTLSGGALAVDGNVALPNRVVLQGAERVSGDNELTLSGIVSGAGSLTIGSGALKLELAGTQSNTHAGAIVVSTGTLELAKTSSATAVGNGGVIVGSGSGLGTLIINGTNQFSAAAALDVRANGRVEGGLFLNNVDRIIMTGGQILEPNLRSDGSLVTNASSGTALIGAGTLELAGGFFPFSVANGAPFIDLDVAARVRGTGITKTGPGTLRLSGDNLYTSGTNLQDGTLLIGHNNALGSGPLTTTGGGVIATLDPRIVNNTLIFTGNATVEGDFPLTLNGPSSGAGALVKNGTATLTIGGSLAQAHTGGTVINSGTLVLAKTGGAAAIGTGGVIVGNGAGVSTLIINGGNQFSTTGALDVRANGRVNGGGFLNNVNQIIMTGGEILNPNLRTDGSISVNASSPGSIIGAGTLDLANGVRTFSVADGGAVIDLDIAAIVQSGGINKTGAGALRLSGDNTYASGTSLQTGTLLLGHNDALGNGALTTTGGVIAADGTARTVNNALVLNGNATVAGSLALTFNGPSSGAGALIKNGNATLTVGGALANAHTGGTVVNSGTLVLAKALAAGPGTLTIGAAGRAVAVAGLPAAVKVSALGVAVGGKLDLTNNDMIIDYTGATPLATILGYIGSAYNGGAWTGNGINSSHAAAAAPTPDKTGVGYVEATDIFSTFPANFRGQSVDATSILIGYTLFGDTNLDRTVNISDFSRLAANFNTPSRWFNGDFNYDGNTNISDFALLAANFNKSLPADLPVLSAVEGPRGASVPEPGALVILGIAAALKCHRRRRSN